MARIRRATGQGPTPGPLASYAGHNLECRSFGHAWSTVGYFESGGRVRRRLMCGRCQTDRTDSWSRNGDRFAPRYDYPEGYRYEPGASIKPYQVRQEVIRRATIYTSEAEMLAAITNGAR